MDGDRIKEWAEKGGAVLIVVLAVAWGLSYKGLSGETLADALKDIGGAIVPVFAALFAARLVREDAPREQRYLAEGERALRAVQKRFEKKLQGPQYLREGYDPEGGGKGDRYLFIQALAGRVKASLVPLSPLAEGIVAITVSKQNLINLGRSTTPEEGAHAAVKTAVEAILQGGRFTGQFEILQSKNKRAAIVVDFDEEAMGVRRFRGAVEAVVTAAVEALLALPEGPRVGTAPTVDEADG